MMLLKLLITFPVRHAADTGLVWLRRWFYHHKLNKLAGKPFVLFTAKILAWEQEGFSSRGPSQAWDRLPVAKQAALLSSIRERVEQNAGMCRDG